MLPGRLEGLLQPCLKCCAQSCFGARRRERQRKIRMLVKIITAGRNSTTVARVMASSDAGNGSSTSRYGKRCELSLAMLHCDAADLCVVRRCCVSVIRPQPAPHQGRDCRQVMPYLQLQRASLCLCTLSRLLATTWRDAIAAFMRQTPKLRGRRMHVHDDPYALVNRL